MEEKKNKGGSATTTVKKKKKKAASENNEIITLTNVSKAYSTGAPALKEVNLHINRGEFVFIVGDSGSGKSTLIKLLLRELTISDGYINVMGYDLSKIKHRKIPKFRATDALSEFICPNMGILIIKSHFSRTIREMP